METCGGKVQDSDLEKSIQLMLSKARVDHKSSFTFEDFLQIMGSEIKILNAASLGFSGVGDTHLQHVAKEIESIYV